MTRFATACATTLALATVSPVWGQSAEDMGQLTGVWRMTSLEAGPVGEDRAPVAYSGQIVFTDAGTMSVQAMDPNPEATSPYVTNGYEAFFGTVDVDADAGTFVVTVDSALVRDLIGQELERGFEVSDDALVLMPTSPEENWRVTYERL